MVQSVLLFRSNRGAGSSQRLVILGIVVVGVICLSAADIQAQGSDGIGVGAGHGVAGDIEVAFAAVGDKGGGILNLDCGVDAQVGLPHGQDGLCDLFILGTAAGAVCDYREALSVGVAGFRKKGLCLFHILFKSRGCCEGLAGGGINNALGDDGVCGGLAALEDSIADELSVNCQRQGLTHPHILQHLILAVGNQPHGGEL